MSLEMSDLKVNKWVENASLYYISFCNEGWNSLFPNRFSSSSIFLSDLQEEKFYQQNGLMVLWLGMHMQNR